MKFLKSLWAKITSATSRLFLGIMMFFAAFANAQDASYPRDLTLTWTNPSMYTDGGVIEAGDLESVRFECANNLTPTVLVLDASLADNGEGQPQSNTWPGIIPGSGTYTCYAWATVVDGSESAASAPALKKHLGTPLPPIILTFE